MGVEIGVDESVLTDRDYAADRKTALDEVALAVAERTQHDGGSVDEPDQDQDGEDAFFPDDEDPPPPPRKKRGWPKGVGRKGQRGPMQLDKEESSGDEGGGGDPPVVVAAHGQQTPAAVPIKRKRGWPKGRKRHGERGRMKKLI